MTETFQQRPSKGKVYLVGAGPGDPELITVRGLRLIEAAEVVVHDRLVDSRLIQKANTKAEIVDVGKGPDTHTWSQEAINSLLIARATDGLTVVRLKGGDPFIFGRGGEEAQALTESGVDFEIVPGITSAIAVPSYAGIPLTHRLYSSSVIFLTGQEYGSEGTTKAKWKDIAAAADTIVILMGLKNLSRIVSELLNSGLDESTPVAVIQWGSKITQNAITGTLTTILQKVRQAKLEPPVVTVVGKVVELRKHLAWFDNKPLFGKRILVTRSRHQAATLANLLQEHGAQITAVPAIKLEPISQALINVSQEINKFSWIVFTSSNTVELFFRELHQSGLDTRALGKVRVCAIGSATSDALRTHGITADLMPIPYVAENLVEALRSQEIAGQKVLLPQAELVRGELVDGLRRAGALVEEIRLYRTVLPKESKLPLIAALVDGIDVLTFTSSSTVRNVVTLVGNRKELLDSAIIASIGPVTSATARELGLTVHIQAVDHTVPGLVEAIINYVQAKGDN